jgi:FKBP-type peptidyl-prolyl cis-trans isomerase 2
MPIKKGDKVKVEYKGTLSDGTVFDSTEKHGAPLEFEVGSQQLMEGFENAIIGMEKGEEKEFSLTSDEAYGEYNEELVKSVPRDQLPKDQDFEAGNMLVMGLPNGIQITAQITEITEDIVTLDLNHPLAGKDLTFKVKIVDVAS